MAATKSFQKLLYEVVNRASIALLIRIAGASISFLYVVYLGRTLGVKGTGIYFLAFTIMTIGTVFGRFGLDNVLLRRSAYATSSKNKLELEGLYKSGIVTGLSLSLLVSLILYGLAPVIAASMFNNDELSRPIRLFALTITPMSLLTLHAELFKGISRVADSQLSQWLLIPVLALTIFALWGKTFGVLGAIISYTTSVYIALFAVVFRWNRKGCAFRLDGDWFPFRKLLSEGASLFWIASMNLVTTWLGVLILGVVATEADVGVYSVASRLSVLISFILVAVNAAASAKIVELVQNSRFDELRYLIWRSSLIMVALAAPLFIAVLLLGEVIMSAFGQEFVSGASVLAILVGGQFVITSVGLSTNVMMMAGHIRQVKNHFYIALVVNVLLALSLASVYGALGAAYAASASLILMHGLSAFWVIKNVTRRSA